MVTHRPLARQNPRFSETLRVRAAQIRSWLCVGIDPDLERLPSDFRKTISGLVDFCRATVDATEESALAYKLNFAFFESLGPKGWEALAEVRSCIPNRIPVIADAKRADIANSSAKYAEAVFGTLCFDAITVNPYMGWDALDPFFSYPGKAAFVLCRTSNPGGTDFQELLVKDRPLYQLVAERAIATRAQADVGLVVGATSRRALRVVRTLSERTLLLAIGVGTQGASVADAIRDGANGRGENALIGVSRQILYASSGSNFAEEAQRVAKSLAAETWTGAKHAQADC